MENNANILFTDSTISRLHDDIFSLLYHNSKTAPIKPSSSSLGTIEHRLPSLYNVDKIVVVIVILSIKLDLVLDHPVHGYYLFDCHLYTCRNICLK